MSAGLGTATDAQIVSRRGRMPCMIYERGCLCYLGL